MPEKAKVAIFEDHLSTIERMKKYIESSGHSVIAVASTLEEALLLIRSLREKGVQVATIDGNLNSKSSGNDGDKILRAIKESAPEIKTIGFSTLGGIRGVDIDMMKPDWHLLGEAITKL